VLVKVKMCSSQYPDIIGRGIGNQNFLPKIGIGLMDALYTDDRFKLFPLWEVVQYIVIKSIEFHIQSSFGMFPFLFVLLMLLMLFMLLMVMMVLKFFSVVTNISQGNIQTGVFKENIGLRAQYMAVYFLIR